MGIQDGADIQGLGKFAVQVILNNITTVPAESHEVQIIDSADLFDILDKFPVSAFAFLEKVLVITEGVPQGFEIGLPDGLFRVETDGTLPKVHACNKRQVGLHVVEFLLVIIDGLAAVIASFVEGVVIFEIDILVTFGFRNRRKAHFHDIDMSHRQL